MRKGRGMNNTKWRAAMFGEQNGLCHYCRTPMRNDWKNVTDHKNRMTGRPPDNMATIEHMRSRNGACHRVVAACFNCNETRGRVLGRMLEA